MSNAARITSYPPEKHYLNWVFPPRWACILPWCCWSFSWRFLTHVKTIEQLMAEGGSIAQSGPAPEENIEVTLQPEELPPPPPVVVPNSSAKSNCPSQWLSHRHLCPSRRLPNLW